METGKKIAQESLTLLIQDQLDDLFRNDFFDELDVLSTHTRPEAAEDVEITIQSIDNDWIEFTGTGSVLCELQYGSDGDVRRGDGAVSRSSFPFTFHGRSPTNNPEAVEVERDAVEIDASSFYE